MTRKLVPNPHALLSSVTEETLGQRAKSMKMDFDDFITETKKALTRQNLGNLNFEYSLKKEGSGHTFSWKKFMAKDKIRVSVQIVCLSYFVHVTEIIPGSP